jgi:hypothetical protein
MLETEIIDGLVKQVKTMGTSLLSDESYKKLSSASVSSRRSLERFSMGCLLVAPIDIRAFLPPRKMAPPTL